MRLRDTGASDESSGAGLPGTSHDTRLRSVREGGSVTLLGPGSEPSDPRRPSNPPDGPGYEATKPSQRWAHLTAEQRAVVSVLSHSRDPLSEHAVVRRVWNFSEIESHLALCQLVNAGVVLHTRHGYVLAK